MGGNLLSNLTKVTSSSGGEVPIPYTAIGRRELGVARYQAQQVPGAVILFANGCHPTSGYEVSLERSLLAVYPPEFILYQIPPSGPVAQVVTPFSVCAWFAVTDPVETVAVHDANGRHAVEVEQVLDLWLPRESGIAKLFRVESVDLKILKSKPPILAIDVKGLSPTPGYTDVTLIEHVYVTPPEDGVYGFDLVGRRPSHPVPQVLAPVSTVYHWTGFHDEVRGVRVHATSNKVEALLERGDQATA